MMFAIITPALITGAFTNRITFKAYLAFLIVWQLFVYFPFVHMIWGGGFLAQWGVLDFAGGIVVHNRGLGRAGLGPLRRPPPLPRRAAQHALVALGTGLLWFGWYGFNAGSEFKVDSVTALAFSTPTSRHPSPRSRGWWSAGGSRSGRPGRATDRGGRRAGHHHAGRRLRSPLGLGRHRHRRGCRLLLRGPVKERGAVGRRARCLGGTRGRGHARVVLLGVFARTATNPNGAQGLIHGAGTFFGKEVAAGAGCSAYASGSPT